MRDPFWEFSLCVHFIGKWIWSQSLWPDLRGESWFWGSGQRRDLSIAFFSVLFGRLCNHVTLNLFCPARGPLEAAAPCLTYPCIQTQCWDLGLRGHTSNLWRGSTDILQVRKCSRASGVKCCGFEDTEMTGKTYENDDSSAEYWRTLKDQIKRSTWTRQGMSQNSCVWSRVLMAPGGYSGNL